MACLDDLIDEVSSLKSVIGSGSGCGCGAGGAGSSTVPLSEVDTGDITEPTGTPPDGYEDWAAYVQRKCDLATWIVSNLLSDIQWLQAQQLLLLTAGGLLLGLVGFLALPVLVGILGVALVIGGYESTILDDLEQAIQTAFDDIVCALYTSHNAAAAQTAAFAVLDAEIDVQTADTLARLLLKQLSHYWFDATSANLMFAESADVEAKQIPTAQDCSGCGIPPFWDCSIGTLVSNTETSAKFDALLLGDGVYWASFGFDHTEAITWALTGGSLVIPDPSPAFVIFVDTNQVQCGSGSGASWETIQNDFTNNSPYSCWALQIRSDVAFQVEFSI